MNTHQRTKNNKGSSREGSREPFSFHKTCGRCGQGHNRFHQSYCNLCHAAYMREHRPKYWQLTKEQKFKDTCRSYANVYQRRGKLIKPTNCQLCGSESKFIEKHHYDYSKPLDVVWVCRPCHLDHHYEIAEKWNSVRKTL